MASFVLIPGAGGMAWYWFRVVPQSGSSHSDSFRVRGVPTTEESGQGPTPPCKARKARARAFRGAAALCRRKS
jgi:hypothetical protein